jgi:GT2 family glycosyltransferase
MEREATLNLAVVIPAYNHLPEVMHALNSLRALRACEVAFHVQDDCSPEVNHPICIPQEIASTGRNERNLGFAGNCNIGAREAIMLYQPDVLFFVNQDCYAVNEWSMGWDTALLSAFDDPTVGIVGARLLFPDNRIQNAGGVFDALSQPTHRCLGWSNPHHAECSTRQEVEWNTGAALAIRTSVFVQLRGFDESYQRGYFEDVDLCLRAREAGYKVLYEPACTLLHSVGSTGGSPYFAQNARRFKAQWVDSGKVKRGTLTATARFW